MCYIYECFESNSIPINKHLTFTYIYIYIYHLPSAFPPPCPRRYCIMVSKKQQNLNKKLPQIGKNGDLGWFWGLLGELLGAFWPQDGPKLKKDEKSDLPPPGPKLGAKIGAGDRLFAKKYIKIGAGQANRKKMISDDTRSGPMSLLIGKYHMFGRIDP